MQGPRTRYMMNEDPESEL